VLKPRPKVLLRGKKNIKMEESPNTSLFEDENLYKHYNKKCPCGFHGILTKIIGPSE
jgi:hypothetical protein